MRELRVLRSPRGQAAVDWAENALANRGAAFIIAARYIPIGRVAVNMTAGAVGYSRRRFMGLYRHRRGHVGLLLGAHRHRRRGVVGHHTLVAVAVGVVGGLAIGVVIDWVLRHVHAPPRAAVATRRSGWPTGTDAPPARGGPPGHRTLTIRPRRLTIRANHLISPMTVLTL